MVRQVVYHCAAASGTGTAGEPPPSGAESGCVREAVWKPHCGSKRQSALPTVTVRQRIVLRFTPVSSG